MRSTLRYSMPVAIIAQDGVLVNMRDSDINEQKLLCSYLDAALGKGCRQGKHKAHRCFVPWQIGRLQSAQALARTGRRRG